MKLFQNPDGANYQARAVLAYLTRYEGIRESWTDEYKMYNADPRVGRWHNCREQGYVISLHSRGRPGRQLNIAFYECRNGDHIEAMAWEEDTIFSNPPTLHSKTDRTPTWHSVDYGRASEMAEWIFEELRKFWIETSVKKEI